MEFKAKADRNLIRAQASSKRYVRVELRAPEAPPRAGRMPVNLGLVIDRSGSMSGTKIEMARAAVLRAIQTLRPEDRFSVVAYDTAIDVLVPSTKATPEARTAAERAVKALEPGSSTDLCGGWLRGCEQVGLHLADEQLGRCLLLTDGLANAGITNHAEILEHVTALRARQVTTTTFGVGADFDEVLLRRMAEAGGGNFYFIENSAQISDFLAGEVGDMLEVTARDAALVIQTGEGVVVESLNGFRCRRVTGGTWRVELGSLLSGQTMDPVLALSFPEGTLGSFHAVSIGLVDRGQTLITGLSVTFRCASHEENDAQPRERAVDRRVAALYAAKAGQEALELNRDGEYDDARRKLEACARRIAEYAGDDAEIAAILEDLKLKAQRVAKSMRAEERKSEYSATNASLTLQLAPRFTRH